MALNNLNKIGLDNVPTNNVLGGVGQTPNTFSSINLTTPTASVLNSNSMDALGVRLNNNRLNSIEPIVDTYNSNVDLTSLANQVGTQEARVAAAAGPEMLSNYEEEKKKESKGLLGTLFDILDAPRNALFNAVKYAVEDNADGVFTGLIRGFTHEDEYSGYDMVKDVFGLEEGMGKTLAGFAAEVLLDPVNWFTFGASALGKGVVQGATKNVAKELAEKGLKEGAKQLGEQAVREGAEELGEEIISSGLVQAGKTAARHGIQEAIDEGAQAAAKSSNSLFGSIINRLDDEVEKIANIKGWQFGPAKVQAVYDEALKEVRSTAKLAGGLTDDVLNLASNGSFGDDIARQADDLIKTKAAVAAKGATATDLTMIADKQDELLKALYPHQVDLRIEALAAKGIDSASLKSRLASVYEEQMTGALISLKNKYNVATVSELRDALAEQLGKDITDGDLLRTMANEAFTSDILGQIPSIYLKTNSAPRNKRWNTISTNGYCSCRRLS